MLADSSRMITKKNVVMSESETTEDYSGACCNLPAAMQNCQKPAKRQKCAVELYDESLIAPKKNLIKAHARSLGLDADKAASLVTVRIEQRVNHGTTNGRPDFYYHVQAAHRDGHVKRLRSLKEVYNWLSTACCGSDSERLRAAEKTGVGTVACGLQSCATQWDAYALSHLR